MNLIRRVAWLSEEPRGKTRVSRFARLALAGERRPNSPTESIATHPLFDKFLTRTQTRAEHELSEQMRSQRQTIKAALATLRALGVIILDDSVGHAVMRSRLFAAVPRDALEAQVAGLDEWVTGQKSDVFHGLVRRFSHLRQFSPVLLRALEFLPDAGDAKVPCLEAIRVLKEMNADLKRKLPEDAPTDFIPKRLWPLVMTGPAHTFPLMEKTLRNQAETQERL